MSKILCSMLATALIIGLVVLLFFDQDRAVAKNEQEGAPEETSVIENTSGNSEPPAYTEAPKIEPDDNNNHLSGAEPPRVNEITDPDEVSRFVKSVQGLPTLALSELMKRLREDPYLSQQWLDSLLQTEPDEVPQNADQIIAVLEREQVAKFLQNAFVYGSLQVKAVGAAAMAKRQDIDLVESGLGEALAGYATDPRVDQWAAQNAIQALGKNGSAEDIRTAGAAEPLRSLLSHDNHLLRSQTVSTMLRSGFESTDVDSAINGLVAHQNDDVRVHSLELVGWWAENGYKPSDQTLRSMVESATINLPETVLEDHNLRDSILAALSTMPLSQAHINIIEQTHF